MGFFDAFKRHPGTETNTTPDETTSDDDFEILSPVSIDIDSAGSITTELIREGGASQNGTNEGKGN